jgi:hypothetical protein
MSAIASWQQLTGIGQLLRMKSPALAVMTIAVWLLGLSACTSRPEALIGTYHLVNASDCRNDVRDATLIIREDGTYDEQVRLTSGEMQNIQNERWEFDSRITKIRFSKLLVSPQTSFDVEPKHPVFIFVNPVRDCWYGQPE